MTRTEALDLMDQLQQLAGPLSISPDKKELAVYVAEQLYKITDELFLNHVEERKKSYARVSVVA